MAEAGEGIRARSRRGAFGQSWWAKRWAEVIEGFDLGARLGRGKTYAREGHVLSIRVELGEVTAEVQGSRRRPYRVRVAMKPFSAAQRKKLARRLSEEPRLAASLLAGEMPREIEDVCDAAGVPLFPVR